MAFLLCSAPADVIVLDDATLLAFGDVGGTAASTLDATIDTPGDPGVQYVVTWANQSGYTDIALGQYNPTAFGIGDTVQAEIMNLDPVYPTLARFYMQVDGWAYNQGAGVWIGAGATETISMVNPAVTEINSVGIKLGTDSWTNRPDGSTVAVEVVPEPSVMALLGMGALWMVLRRKRG